MNIEKLFRVVLVVGLGCAIAVAAWAMSHAESLLAALSWLIWPAMIVHQCEEHLFTELALGRKFAFLNWVRSVGYDLSAGLAMRLNIGIGWTLGLAAGVCGSASGNWLVMVPVFVATVEAVNGFWHLSVTSFERRWSPGTLSGVLFSIPLAFALVHHALAAGLVTATMSYGLLLAACLSHHLFLGSLPRISERESSPGARLLARRASGRRARNVDGQMALSSGEREPAAPSRAEAS